VVAERNARSLDDSKKVEAADVVVDSDIRRAQTLDSSYYTDPALYEVMKDKIFRGAWHYLGTIDEVTQPGQAVAKILGPGTLDEPVILVQDLKGQVRVLSNVCTHRGMILVQGAYQGTSLRCGYHGRRFGFDGRLKTAPGFEGAVDFPGACDHLPELAVGQWGRLLFASLDPQSSFEAWIQPVAQRMNFLDAHALELAPDRGRDYRVKAPWMAYCDNYLEGLHIPYVHPGLSDALDLSAYHTELFEHVSLQVGVATGAEHSFEVPPAHPDYAGPAAGYYFFLFPNIMMNFYPWGLSLNLVNPEGVGACRVRFLSFVGKEALLGEGASADLHQVELEDEAVVQSVAQGLQSHLFTNGRYAPEHERCVHHFHLQLQSRMNHS
jgi:choline monooxygenase